MSIFLQSLFNPRLSSILLIWLVFWFRGIVDNSLAKIIEIPGWLPALFLILFFSVIIKKRERTYYATVPELLVILLFLLSIPSAVEGYKLESFSIISLILSVVICIRWGSFKPLSIEEKQWICNLSFLTALASILMFFYFIFIDPPKLGFSEVRPGFGYAIDRGILLRLVGFTSDPNFYCLGIMLPLLICIKERLIKYRKLFISVFLFSFLLTLSRSGAIILLFGLILLFFSDIKRFYSILVYACIGAVVTIIGVTVYGSRLLLSSGGEFDRGFISGGLSRFSLIDKAMDQGQIMYFGNGIGKTKELIGYHSHNTYFDFLFELGLIPFSVFLIYTLILLIYSFKNLNPFSIFTILIFVSIFSVSLPFNPLLYLPPLVCLRMKYVENNN